MATEVWLRNPQRSIRQALAEGVERYVFDQALINWRKQSPHQFMRQHFIGTGINPQYLLVGDQGARLYNLFTTPDKPLAVWPTWDPSQGLDLLEHYLAVPQGEDFLLCTDPDLELSTRPVFGQEHRVVITGGLRTKGRGPTKDAAIGEVRQTCENYPDAIVHLSGAGAFSTMFNWDWHSVDWSTDEPRVYGQLQLPNGIALPFAKNDEWALYSDWVELLGFTVDRLNKSREEQVHFHVRSLLWAGENYDVDYRAKRRYSPTIAGAQTPPSRWSTLNANTQRNWRQASTVASRALPMFGKTNGDKAWCDYCVYRTSCKTARAGQVCGLEETEMGELAKHFGSRNPDSIIDGLTKLVALQADRLEESMAGEDVQGEGGPNPEVTRQINSVFGNATALAKLLNPNLNGKGTTITNQTLNINGGNIPFASNDPRQVMSAIVKELTDAGIKRDEITPDMIKAILRQGGDQQALEGVVVQNQAGKE